jgi:hypothetical protein
VQYFVHLAHRLGYVNDAVAADFDSKTRQTFGCFHGLIRAAEQEAG